MSRTKKKVSAELRRVRQDLEDTRAVLKDAWEIKPDVRELQFLRAEVEHLKAELEDQKNERIEFLNRTFREMYEGNIFAERPPFPFWPDTPYTPVLGTDVNAHTRTVTAARRFGKPRLTEESIRDRIFGDDL